MNPTGTKDDVRILVEILLDLPPELFRLAIGRLPFHLYADRLVDDDVSSRSTTLALHDRLPTATDRKTTRRRPGQASPERPPGTRSLAEESSPDTLGSGWEFGERLPSRAGPKVKEWRSVSPPPSPATGGTRSERSTSSQGEGRNEVTTATLPRGPRSSCRSATRGRSAVPTSSRPTSSLSRS